MGNLSILLRNRVEVLVIAISLLAMLVVPLLGRFPLYLGQLVGINIVYALGLSIIYGYCGRFNFGAAGWYAIGAYASAYFVAKYSVNYLLTIPIALIISVFVTLLIGTLLLRLRHHLLALGTIAFSSVIYKLCTLDAFGGESGMSLPKLVLFGYTADDSFVFCLIVVIAAICYLGCHWLVSSRVGRAWKSIKEDERAALAIGINVNNYVMLALIVSGLLFSMAGVLLAEQNRWIAPSQVDIWVNVLVVLMVVIGGVGSNFGAVVGALIITVLPEIAAAFKDYYLVIYAVLLFVVLRFLPQGIVGSLKNVVASSSLRKNR
jgi:branched-chain amino acid transport system permease protein